MAGRKIGLEFGEILRSPNGAIMNHSPASLCVPSSASKLRRRRKTRTGFDGPLARVFAILLLLALAVPLAAQEARSNELIKQVRALHR
jgi:hypothetical protein